MEADVMAGKNVTGASDEGKVIYRECVVYNIQRLILIRRNGNPANKQSVSGSDANAVQTSGLFFIQQSKKV